MPTNRVIYLGVLVVAASALLWLGAELAKRIEWILPYTGVIGIALVLIGVAMEVRNKREGSTGPVDTAGTGSPDA